MGMAKFGKTMMQNMIESQKIVASLGKISDETFSLIKLIKAMVGEQHQINKFNSECDRASSKLIKNGKKAYFWQGIFYACIYILYGCLFIVSYFFITKEVHNHNTGKPYDIGTIF